VGGVPVGVWVNVGVTVNVGVWVLVKTGVGVSVGAEEHAQEAAQFTGAGKPWASRAH